ncbi:roadblock/LC7 domain-containing protein [Candidatus Solincola tengchongensis]|uniref:roadblock/LC7 domain-containing protein n=1 Tax=Candidatus Solincola tengchongensis TaxID=2900693 RepID=UPI00257FCE57|nr:roadblock/LC7 domain-containing protein [Candidatus Solincola tengchongensis]
MVSDRIEKMNSILRQLRSNLPEIEAAVLISADAMALASDMSDEADEEMIGALSASVLSMGERAARDLKRGALEQVYVKGDQGYLLLLHCGPDALLSLLVRPEAKLGVVFMEAKRTAEELSALFQ